MTQVLIDEQTPQGKSLLSLIKTMSKKVATLEKSDDLSNCITSNEFGKLLIKDLEKKYREKSNR